MLFAIPDCYNKISSTTMNYSLLCFKLLPLSAQTHSLFYLIRPAPTAKSPEARRLPQELCKHTISQALKQCSCLRLICQKEK